MEDLKWRAHDKEQGLSPGRGGDLYIVLQLPLAATCTSQTGSIFPPAYWD
jgi:hypothetical protein